MRSSAGSDVDHLPHAEAPHRLAVERVIAAMRERVDDTLPPLTVRGGQIDEQVDVTLRPLQVTDLPILVSLPALLLERVAPDGQRQRAR